LKVKPALGNVTPDGLMAVHTNSFPFGAVSVVEKPFSEVGLAKVPATAPPVPHEVGE